MFTQRQSKHQGFTLVEIMIVVAIIALLASLAVPSFLRARKRSQATSTLESLRMVDSAKEQYAIENSKGGTLVPAYADLIPYIKKGSHLYNDLVAGKATDILGNDITINSVDLPPQVNATTKSALNSVLGSNPADFWGAYN